MTSPLRVAAKIVHACVDLMNRHRRSGQGSMDRRFARNTDGAEQLFKSSRPVNAQSPASALDPCQRRPGVAGEMHVGISRSLNFISRKKATPYTDQNKHSHGISEAEGRNGTSKKTCVYTHTKSTRLLRTRSQLRNIRLDPRHSHTRYLQRTSKLLSQQYAKLESSRD